MNLTCPGPPQAKRFKAFCTLSSWLKASTFESVLTSLEISRPHPWVAHLWSLTYVRRWSCWTKRATGRKKKYWSMRRRPHIWFTAFCIFLINHLEPPLIEGCEWRHLHGPRVRTNNEMELSERIFACWTLKFIPAGYWDHETRFDFKE